MPYYHLIADATTYVPLAPLPGLNTNSNDLTAYLNSAFTVTISLAAVLAVIMIVVGGFQYLTAEAAQNKEAGKHTITQALLGLALLLGSWLILHVIDPHILNLDLFNTDLGKVQGP